MKNLRIPIGVALALAILQFADALELAVWFHDVIFEPGVQPLHLQRKGSQEPVGIWVLFPVPVFRARSSTVSTRWTRTSGHVCCSEVSDSEHPSSDSGRSKVIRRRKLTILIGFEWHTGCSTPRHGRRHHGPIDRPGAAAPARTWSRCET